MNEFEKSLHSKRDTVIKATRPSTNLTKIQEKQLYDIQKDHKFIILMADKKLGPAVMEREQYIKLILNEHLCDGQTYDNITTIEAHDILSNLCNEYLFSR